MSQQRDREKWFEMEDGGIGVLIDRVKLLGGGILFQQLAGHLPLRRKDNSILGKNTEGGTGMGDGFQRILDLIQATLGGEDGGLPNSVIG